MPATFAYWNIRGLGQSIRLMLEYTGTEYTEKQYGWGPAPGFDPSQWTNEKFTLGMDFPNLPYFFSEDGKYKITQSHAILKHLGRTHSLVGKCEKGSVRMDMVEHESQDMRAAWIKLVYDTPCGFEKNKEDYKMNNLKPRLEKLSKFLCKHSWFAGEYITFVDFLMYELLDINRHLFSCCLDDFANLQQYMKRFESLEPIKKYMNSPRYMKTPLNGPMAGYVGN